MEAFVNSLLQPIRQSQAMDIFGLRAGSRRKPHASRAASLEWCLFFGTYNSHAIYHRNRSWGLMRSPGVAWGVGLGVRGIPCELSIIICLWVQAWELYNNKSRHCVSCFDRCWNTVRNALTYLLLTVCSKNKRLSFSHNPTLIRPPPVFSVWCCAVDSSLKLYGELSSLSYTLYMNHELITRRVS